MLRFNWGLLASGTCLITEGRHDLPDISLIFLKLPFREHLVLTSPELCVWHTSSLYIPTVIPRSGCHQLHFTEGTRKAPGADDTPKLGPCEVARQGSTAGQPAWKAVIFAPQIPIPHPAANPVCGAG